MGHSLVILDMYHACTHCPSIDHACTYIIIVAVLAMHVHTYCSRLVLTMHVHIVAILTRHVLGSSSVFITSYHKGGDVSWVGQWEEMATYYQVNCKPLIGVHSTMHLVDPIKGLH